MRIAISATGPKVDAEVDSHFARCQYFIIVDPETMEFEALENSTSDMADGEAGISTGQMIASKGVEAVLSGKYGPNAYQVLSAAGIRLITGVSGKVRDAIQSYRSRRDMMVKQVSLSVNDVPIQLDEFAKGYIYHVARSIVASLKDTGAIETLELSIDNEGQVTINLDNSEVLIKYLPNEIIKSTILGIVTPLRGVSEVGRLQLSISG